MASAIKRTDRKGNNKSMKLITLLAIAIGTIGVAKVRAGEPLSDYANADLVLTSSNESELATADASSGAAGDATAQAQPGSTEDTLLAMGLAEMTGFENETVSGFSDELTITGPGMTGSSGSLEFHFLVNGSDTITALAAGSASLTGSADFTGPGGLLDDLSFTENSAGVVTSGANFLGVPETVVVPFVFGTPFTFSLQVSFTGLVSGNAMVSGSFSTTASTSNVMALFAGEPISASDYSANSASGVNYFAVSPVPEPDELILAMAGLAALPLLRRWRRQSGGGA